MTTMTSLERVATAVQLKEPDMVPVIPVVMLRALREIGAQASEENLHNPHLMAQAKMEAFRNLGGDAVFAGTGLGVEAEAMGCVLEYQEEEIPVVIERPLESSRSLDQLGRVEIGCGRVGAVAQELEILSREYGQHFLVGCAFSGPFTTAMELQGLENGVQDMQNDPEYLEALLDLVTEQTIAYADILMDAGAVGLVMLEPLCSSDCISPDTYRRWALPWEQRVISHIKSKGRVPVLHVCTYTQPIWDDIAESGALAYHGDILPSLAQCKKAIGGRMCLIGNVQPVEVLLYGSVADVQEAASQCIQDAGRGGGFVLAAGCDTGYGVPSENIQALVETARAHAYPLR
jgi:MtaA/CmuA family methyltransferase